MLGVMPFHFYCARLTPLGPLIKTPLSPLNKGGTRLFASLCYEEGSTANRSLRLGRRQERRKLNRQAFSLLFSGELFLLTKGGWGGQYVTGLHEIGISKKLLSSPLVRGS